MSDAIVTSRTGAVCEVRLNRPEKRNAITFAMYEALVRELRVAQADAAVRAVLLCGAGVSFSAGNDLNDFLSGPAFGPQHPVLALLTMLATYDKPLLAAVHGRTVGIGVTMLLHCDLVLAARGTQFSLPFVKLGLVPEAASSLLLPRLVGPQRAAELLLLGEPFEALRAQQLGLVNRVVEEEALLSEAHTLAAAVAGQPAAALQATRRLLRGDPAQVLERIHEEARIFGALLQSAEFRAAVRAVLHKPKSP